MLIDLVKIKLNGDTGGGGKPATLESLSVSENGVYVPSEGVDGYNQVNVNVVPSTNYSYYDGGVDVEGLRALGWSDESIGMFRDNAPHYSWQNDEFIVSEENKALYGVINKNNIRTYTDNPNIVFMPMFDINGISTYINGLRDYKHIKGVPILDLSNATNINYFFSNCYKLITIPAINTSKVTSMQSMFYDCSSLTTIPQLDTSKVTNMQNMFYNCSKLTTIPQLDTSSVTNMNSMFNSCSSLTTIPAINTHNVTNMSYMFSSCSSLTTIPAIDTHNVTNMSYMFSSCYKLITIPAIDTSKVTDMKYMFNGCSLLQSLPLLDMGGVSSSSNINYFFGYSNITTLTDLGGFKNLKINWNDSYGLEKLPNLTYQSVMNVINNLYDFRGNGDTTTTRTIKFNSKSIALLSDADIAIATNKGWVIS